MNTETNQTIMSAEKKLIKDRVLAEYEKGNVVFATVDGLMSAPLKEFVEQSADGILYDLNRNEAVVLTFIDDPKWINDFAVAKVIKELKSQAAQSKAKGEGLVPVECYVKSNSPTDEMLYYFDTEVNEWMPITRLKKTTLYTTK